MRPMTMMLPGDTPIYQVKIEAERNGLRPTIDYKNMCWILRPWLKLVKSEERT